MIPPSVAAFFAGTLGRVVMYAALVVIGIVIGWSVQGWRLGNQLVKERAAHAEAMIVAQVKAAQKTAELQRGVDDVRRKHDEVVASITERDAEIAKLRVDVGRLRADSSRMRIDLARYAAGTGPNAGASCEQRATVLANLAAEGAELLSAGAGVVEEGRELLRECARNHDERSEEVRSLLAAWPR